MLAADYDRFLLSIENYDRKRDAKFVELIRGQLSLEIHYQSLYRSPFYRRHRTRAAVLTPKPDHDQQDPSTTAEAGADAEA